MIAVEGLRKRRGDREVLGGIDLRVERGEVAAIVGPSGGGKSTLLRCLNGLDAFDAGSVDIAGHRLGPETSERRDAATLLALRRKVGFVFQQYHLFAHRTVIENLIEAPVQVLGEPEQEARARGMALLERVGLASRRDARPRELSGGEQQRVAIARTLAMRPEVILFDEPTSALDPVMAGEVLRVVEELAKDGLTMLVVTHSMRFARDVARNVHVVADGRVVESGRADAVFARPEHPTTRAFLAQARLA